jgi:hypothetical protein
MKNVDLIEVTLDELAGQQPIAGTEIVLRGVRYHIVNARPPRVVSGRWRRKAVGEAQRKWQLLVEKRPPPPA